MSTNLQEENSEFELSDFLNEELKLFIEENSEGEMRILSKGIDGRFYWCDWFPTGIKEGAKLFEVTIHKASSVHIHSEGWRK